MSKPPTKQQLATLKTAVLSVLVVVEKELAKDIPPVVAALQLICDCNTPLEAKDKAAGQGSNDKTHGQAPADGSSPAPSPETSRSDQSAAAAKPSEVFSNGLKCLKTILSEVQADIPPSPPPKDPPIDAISHQVQFVVAYNASANPTWTLLRFKGPAPTSGSFASLSQTNTHTLTIVIRLCQCHHDSRTPD